MTKKYIITMGEDNNDNKNTVTSNNISDCYKYMLDNKDKLIKDNLLTDSMYDDNEPIEHIVEALSELWIAHDKLLEPIKITKEGEHELLIISALRGATVDNDDEDRELIREVILEQLYKLPDVLSDRAISYILWELEQMCQGIHYWTAD